MAKTNFVDGNPAEQIEGTIVTAAFLNALNNHRHRGLAEDGDGAIDYAADTGSADAYAIALSPALAAHVTGMPISFKAANANTGAATLNVDGLGAVAVKKKGGVTLVAGDIPVDGIAVVAYDGTCYQLLNPASSSLKQIQSIAASVGSNALSLTYNGGTLDFRNATLAVGAPVTGVDVSTISLTVPSGATLGTVNAIQAMLALVVLYNGGSPALGVVNMGGSVNLDETTLLSTTAISDAADSAAVVYSTNAITNSPFRVVGFINITEATAGAWATAPTLVQGHGGQAMAAMQSLGYGQTWQNVTASRSVNTTYYNTTSRPIMLSVTSSGGSPTLTMELYINGELMQRPSVSGTGVTTQMFVSAIIPSGASYKVAAGGVAYWLELR
ncbi:hypothetical protein [Syntrophus aciditrophicus]|uniref:Hypothetical cytosolic protein n=1 Tax=Syntrophus aciditrophicus (strain SB) TaxID=56780 RepID=Q2LQT4_SYNAS|nr:hypothetical protein [Syntrophus aciditrophicus]ABC76443.1 hypothetical cytosolic protein [Syntrophus aciditrophicus SB]